MTALPYQGRVSGQLLQLSGELLSTQTYRKDPRQQPSLTRPVFANRHLAIQSFQTLSQTVNAAAAATRRQCSSTGREVGGVYCMPAAGFGRLVIPSGARLYFTHR